MDEENLSGNRQEAAASAQRQPSPEDAAPATNNLDSQSMVSVVNMASTVGGAAPGFGMQGSGLRGLGDGEGPSAMERGSDSSNLPHPMSSAFNDDRTTWPSGEPQPNRTIVDPGIPHLINDYDMKFGGAVGGRGRTNMASDQMTTSASPGMNQKSAITPDLEHKTEEDRSKSPPRPSIFLQDSFQLSKDQFNQSVHFDAGKLLKDKVSKTQDNFWSTSAVDFNNRIIQMSENDQKLVRELQQRMQKQRQALQSKNLTFEAVQKNFTILQGMCDHQKKETRLLSRQNAKLKVQYEKNLGELTELKAAHEKAVDELQFLRDKNEAFAEADADRADLLQRMDGLEREIERQKVQLEENDFQLRVLKKENEKLKDDMLHVDESLAKSREEQQRLTDCNNRLEMEVLHCRSKAEEDAAKFRELDGRILDLQEQLKDSEFENHNLKDSIQQMKRKIEDKEDMIADLTEKSNNQEQIIVVLKKKLQQRIHAENALRAKLEALTNEHRDAVEHHKKRETTWQDDFAKQSAKLAKTEKDLAEVQRKYTRLENDSNQLIEGLEDDKAGLSRNVEQVTKEGQELEKIVTEQKIGMQRMKQGMRDELEAQRVEYDFQIVDQAREIEMLGETTRDLKTALAETSEKLAKAEEELAETTKKLTDATGRLAATSGELAQKVKQADDLQLQADGAADALEGMRKDMNEMVEMEVAEREEAFARVEADFAAVKETLKETQEQVEESKREKAKKVELLNKEKKRIQELRREMDYMQSKLDYTDRENKRKKRDENERLMETERLHRENEQYKQEMAYIHQNYDLDTLEEKMRSARRTEEWAESFLTELNQLFNVLESFMTCTICNHTISAKDQPPPVLILPCQHSFCGGCHHAKKTKLGHCSNCHGQEQQVVLNEYILELAERYEQFKKPLQGKITWMRTRIDKNFIV